MGAAYSSLGRTKVLYAIFLVLLGVKPSSCEGNQVSALEEMSIFKDKSIICS